VQKCRSRLWKTRPGKRPPTTLKTGKKIRGLVQPPFPGNTLDVRDWAYFLPFFVPFFVAFLVAFFFVAMCSVTSSWQIGLTEPETAC
jgi:hypothetical protein